jgi:hypothetical protein
MFLEIGAWPDTQDELIRIQGQLAAMSPRQAINFLVDMGDEPGYRRAELLIH